MSAPDYEVFVTEKYSTSEGEKTRYRRVGAAWRTRTGDGISLRLVPGLALSGDVVMFPPRDRQQQSRSHDAAHHVRDAVQRGASRKVSDDEMPY